MSAQLLNILRNPLSRKTILLNKIQSQSVLLSVANQYHGRDKIGKREVVGYGLNGEYSYTDIMDTPCPAIRFREETSEIVKLKEKEKGDWKKLTLEEKKQLYRFSFCRTFAEMGAPTGEWKSILAGVFTILSVSLWIYVALKKFVYPPMPESTSLENKKKALEFYIKYRVNPIEGIASKWDYENDRWKD